MEVAGTDTGLGEIKLLLSFGGRVKWMYVHCTINNELKWIYVLSWAALIVAVKNYLECGINNKSIESIMSGYVRGVQLQMLSKRRGYLVSRCISLGSRSFSSCLPEWGLSVASW